MLKNFLIFWTLNRNYFKLSIKTSPILLCIYDKGIRIRILPIKSDLLLY